MLQVGKLFSAIEKKIGTLSCKCKVNWACVYATRWFIIRWSFQYCWRRERNVCALAAAKVYSGAYPDNCLPWSDQSYFLFLSRSCRSVPDGKPQVTSAHNSSSTSIYLNWKPPPKSSIHGEFLGYRLAYNQRDDTSSESVQEIFLRDPSIEVFNKYNIPCE